MRILALCILSLSWLPGCATGKNYLINRSADLADILRLHLMAGPGIAAKLEATRLLHAGGTYTHRVYAAGLHNRAIDYWRESCWSWGVIVGFHHEGELERIDRLSGSYGWNFTRPQDGGIFLPATGDFDLDLLTFRGTLMLLIGIDIEVRVGEVLDFVAGLFQFDPAGDDRDYASMRKPSGTEPAPATEPAEPAEPAASETSG